MINLAKMKAKVNYDQRNIRIGVVVSDATQTVRVRLPNGQQVDAVKRDEKYIAGDQLEIRTDGRVYIVTGAAPLKPLSTEFIVEV